MDFKDSSHNDIVEIYESCTYSSETEICDIVWEYHYQKLTQHNKKFKYQMRMYYPDTINRLLVEAGFHIKDMYFSFNKWKKEYKDHSYEIKIRCKLFENTLKLIL